MNLQGFSRYPLTFGPIPIQPLKRLSVCLGGKVELLVKCEDCNSDLAFGGNRVRKLEYLTPEALEGRYDTLVSISGIQLNRTHQVAVVAAYFGPKYMLAQENWVSYSDTVHDCADNIEMSCITSADVCLDAVGFDIGTRSNWEQVTEDTRKRGGKPFPIPAGYSEHSLGGLGFVGLAEEMCQQEAELGFKFDYTVVCSVTGSIQTGMVVGSTADGRANKVIGIDAPAKPEQMHTQILRITRYTVELVDFGRSIAEKDVVLNTRYDGPEYGLLNEGMLEAVRLCARQEAMLTDPVYEEKPMHGMISTVRSGESPTGSRVLYAHLDGVPTLNVYSFILRND